MLRKTLGSILSNDILTNPNLWVLAGSAIGALWFFKRGRDQCDTEDFAQALLNGLNYQKYTAFTTFCLPAIAVQK